MFRPVAGPLSRPGARATLAISLAMSLFGVVGVAVSMSWIRAEPRQPAELPPAVAETTLEALQVMFDSPMLTGAAVGNVLASGLLVFASFLLTARRPSALWWAQQALVVNVVYTFGRLVAVLVFYRAQADTLTEIMTRQIAAQIEAGLDPITTDVSVWPSIVAISVLTVLMCALYGLMLRRVRRDDVRTFIGGEGAT